jgi:hypothetical protein
MLAPCTRVLASVWTVDDYREASVPTSYQLIEPQYKPTPVTGTPTDTLVVIPSQMDVTSLTNYVKECSSFTYTVTTGKQRSRYLV